MKNEAIPRLRFEGFNDNWINNIIGNVINVSSSKRVHQSEWTSHGVPFLRARNITAHLKGVSLKDPIYISPKTYDEYSSISGVPSIGDLLAVGVGVNIGEPLLVTTTAPFYFKDGNIIWFHNNRFDKYFLYYYFFTNTFKKYIKSTKELGAVPTYTIKSGEETPIKYPSLPEQQLIGKFFAKLDKLIQLQQKKISLLKKLKRGYLQKLFPHKGESVPRLRFKGFHDKWEKAQLKDICKYKVSKYSLKRVKSNNNGEYPVFDASNQMINRINTFDMDKQYISIVKDGSNVGHVVKHSSHSSVINTMNYIIPNNNTTCDFLFYLLHVLNLYKYIVGTGIPHIYFKDYSRMNILIPSLKEQYEIGEFLNYLDKRLNYINQYIIRIKHLKKAYLQKMFC